MINYTALAKSDLSKIPFKYSCIKNLINEDDAELLRCKLPDERLYRSIRESGSDKTYNVLNNILFNLEKQEEVGSSLLTPAWHDLLKDLTSDMYRSHLSELLQEDLMNCYQEITLKIYERGDFLSQHTDKSDVKATHMIFLNKYWEESWGGQLEFAAEKDAVPFNTFSPHWTYSVAFVRSDNSWHSVPAVKNEKAKRIALQVAFWVHNTRHVLPGRIEHEVVAHDSKVSS